MSKSIITRRVLVPTMFLACLSICAAGCEAESKGGKLQTRSDEGKLVVPDPDAPEPPATPAEREQAMKVLDKAIAAHGGAERLARIRAVVQKMHGFAWVMPEQLEADQELSLQFPDKLRFIATYKKPDGKLQVDLALSGNSGWRSTAGNLTDLLGDEPRDVKTQLYIELVAARLPVSEEGTIVKPLPDVKIVNKVARGVRLKQPHRPALNLYFDEESSLLIKLTALVTEAGQPLLRDITYLDYQRFDGVMRPTQLREFRNGSPFLEWLKISYEFPDRIDDKLLQKSN